MISGYSLKTDETTNQEEQTPVVSNIGHAEFSFSYFPNPSKGTTMATFVAPSSGMASLEVYNLAGQHMTTLFNASVSEGNGYNVEFNTSTWSAGMYFIRFTDGHLTTSGKLTVIK